MLVYVCVVCFVCYADRVVCYVGNFILPLFVKYLCFVLF